MNLLLLTGSPGVGKTTAPRRVIDAPRIEPLSAFFTEEIGVGGWAGSCFVSVAGCAGRVAVGLRTPSQCGDCAGRFPATD